MAEETTEQATKPPSVYDIAAAVIAQFLDPTNAAKLQTLVRNTRLDSAKDAVELYFGASATIAGKLASLLVTALNQPQPIYNELAKVAVDGLFGTGGGNAAGAGLSSESAAAKIVQALAPGGTTLEPSAAPVERFVNTIVGMAFEGWMQGWIVEAASAVIPGIEKLETFGDLDNTLADALGLGRLSRRVLSPLIDTTIVTPARWDVNKRYRPELLGASEVARQVARGRMTREAAVEELARQGYSDERIEALLANQRKLLGLDDLFYLVRAGLIPDAEAIQTLREQGYDEQTASKELNIRKLKAVDAIRNDLVGPSIAAYAARQLSEADLDAALAIAIDNDEERREYRHVARARRALRTHSLSPSEVRACVKQGILSVRDYRAALEQDGYDRPSVLALELLLEAELSDDRALADKRAAAEVERLRKEREREEERRKREAEQEAARALARRGDEADLEAAAVRGTIAIGRVEELYRARYDAETVQIYVELLEARREAYLDEQRRRAEAIRLAALRQVSIADLEDAVLRGLLDFGRYENELGQRGFSASQIELLVRTLQARKAELDAAAAAHTQAAAAAKARGIDLASFERLVRRGLRTSAQYAALLRELRFTEPAIVDLVALLDAETAEAAAAAAAAEAAAATRRAPGLSLAELRRIVVLGLAPREAFAQFLLDHKYEPEAQRLLLLDLDHAIALAEGARTKRAAPVPGGSDTSAMSLDRWRQAARLQLVPIDTYRNLLIRHGYNGVELEVETELLLVEIADVQAARQVRERAPLGDNRDLSLAELARAVKAGLRTLEDYQARAAVLGFSADAIATQVRILGDELRASESARARREALGVELKGRGITLAELEAAVEAGALTLAGFVAQLEIAGLAPEDAALLGGLVELRLPRE